MIGDIATVMWKEMRGLLWINGSIVRGLRPLLLSLSVFGIFLPWQFGRDLVESPAALLPWIWVPFLMATGVVADAFAGERERHTLETLLASPLSDASIFAGKLATAILYGWGFALVSALLGVVVVNVLDGGGRIVFYSGEVFIALLAFGLLGTAFMSAVGILVSLRAGTVRQATQTTSILVLALVLVPVVLIQLLPSGMLSSVDTAIEDVGPAVAAVALGLVIAALDAGLIVVGIARFRRSRLILQQD